MFDLLFVLLIHLVFEFPYALKSFMAAAHYVVLRSADSVSGTLLWFFTDKFRSFVDQQPDFAEEYLYTENSGLHSGLHHSDQTKPTLSSLNLQATATTKTANGICADFSPSYGTIDGHLKKHN